MRRLPIYFLIDVSESMVGTPVEEVQNGIRTIIQNLRVDPYALETVFVSIIAFAGKAIVLSPLTELYKFYPPVIPIGGGTSIGAALETLMKDIDKSVQKTTKDIKGDWKPIVFLFTDGNPTDNYTKAFNKWNEKYRNRCTLVAVSIGDNVNVLTLAQITDNILLLKETDAESFSKFFKWVTASIQATSMSVSEQYSDELKLPPRSGINLEKVDVDNARLNPEEYSNVDENFAVLHARCANTHNDYLVKFAKRLAGHDARSSFLGFKDLLRRYDNSYKLVGAYPIDKNTYKLLSGSKTATINSRNLVGLPACPCCGNQIGAVVCSCGGIFCAEQGLPTVCPWCGEEGYLGENDGSGFNINRGLG